MSSDKQSELHRRSFFHRAADGLQGAALAYLATSELTGKATLADENELLPATAGPRRGYDTLPRKTHFPARARWRSRPSARKFPEFRFDASKDT